MKANVAPAMFTRIDGDADHLDRFPRAVDQDVLFVCIHIRSPVPFRRFKTSFGAIKSNLPPLVYGMGIERIRHLGASRITNGQRHGILDVDLVIKNATIADIAVKAFVFLIQLGTVKRRAKVRGLGDIKVKLAISPVIASQAAIAARLAIGTIKLQRPQREDFRRILIEPPVHEVKMVRALMHEKTAGILLARMPSAKIIGPVAPIQQVLIIYRQNLSDDALTQ